MHNNVGQERIPTTLSPVEIPIPSSMLTISDDIAKMLDNLKNIEKETERVAMLTKRMMETPLPEPPMVEPPVVESGFSETPPTNTIHSVARDHGKCSVFGSKRVAANASCPIVWTVYEMALWAGAWHLPTLSSVALDTSPAWQATGRASCAYVCSTLPFTYPSFSFCLSQRKTAYPSFTCSPCTWRSRRHCSGTPWDARQTV